MDFRSLSKYTILDGFGNEVPASIGKTMKFDMDTRKEIAIDNWGAELQSVYIPSSCQCDNIILESHYKVYF